MISAILFYVFVFPSFLIETVHPKSTPLLFLTEAKIEVLVGICQYQRASRHALTSSIRTGTT